jgi:hypothetical protein
MIHLTGVSIFKEDRHLLSEQVHKYVADSKTLSKIRIGLLCAAPHIIS